MDKETAMRTGRSSGPPRRSAVRWGRLFPAGGAALGVVSCVPMVAALPGAAATLLGTLGVSATTGPWGALSRAAAPVAQPLLIVSVLLLVAGALRCGRGPAGATAIGGALLYASMYLLGGPMTTMTTMSTTSGAGTNAPLFYSGVGLIVAAFVWAAVRRRRHTCRPVIGLPRSAT